MYVCTTLCHVCTSEVSIHDPEGTGDVSRCSHKLKNETIHSRHVSVVQSFQATPQALVNILVVKEGVHLLFNMTPQNRPNISSKWEQMSTTNVYSTISIGKACARRRGSTYTENRLRPALLFKDTVDAGGAAVGGAAVQPVEHGDDRAQGPLSDLPRWRRAAVTSAHPLQVRSEVTQLTAEEGSSSERLQQAQTRSSPDFQNGRSSRR